MPSPDIIDEFKIETSNFDASFGHSTGLNISMSTKSGANALHGSATYQYFNQRWNAASFFVKQARYSADRRGARGRKHSPGRRTGERRPMLPPGQTHNYHGDHQRSRLHPEGLRRPQQAVLLPRLFRAEESASRRGRARSTTRCPTVAMRDGDFSTLLQIDPVRYQIYDPLTTRPDPARAGHWVRDPFPGNIIPRDRFNNPMYDFYAQAHAAAEQRSDRPPAASPSTTIIASGMPNNVDYRSFNNRIDYQASARHRFFFRWLKSNFLEDAQDYTYRAETGPDEVGRESGPRERRR